MMSLSELVKGLLIDKSRVSRIVKKLEIIPHKKRGPSRQWEYFFDYNQIKKILTYREGLPHNLIIDKKKFKLSEIYGEIKEIKNRINDQLRRRGEIKGYINDIKEKVKNTNFYLTPLSTLSNLNSKILFYSVEHEEVISNVTEYFETYQPETIKDDLLINEIPDDVDEAKIISNWILRNLNLISNEAQSICENLTGEVIKHSSPLVKILKWISKRNQNIWENWNKIEKIDDIFIDLDSTIHDIGNKDYVIKRQLEKISDCSEKIIKLLESTFGINYKIVFEIGKLGPEKAVVRERLYEEFNIKVVEEILDMLDKKGLVKTSYIT